MSKGHTPHGIRLLKDALRHHSVAMDHGTLDDESIAAGRVVDAVYALPIGDWVILCAALKKGLEVPS